MCKVTPGRLVPLMIMEVELLDEVDDPEEVRCVRDCWDRPNASAPPSSSSSSSEESSKSIIGGGSSSSSGKSDEELLVWTGFLAAAAASPPSLSSSTIGCDSFQHLRTRPSNHKHVWLRGTVTPSQPQQSNDTHIEMTRQ
jgi:hypothetical protein